MMNVPVTLQVRNDTASNWAMRNPVLTKGEYGIEIDTYLLKIGDGLTNWNNLKYLNKLDASYFTQNNDGTIRFSNTFMNTIQTLEAAAGEVITNLIITEPPVNDTDVPNKKYVDDAIQNAAIQLKNNTEAYWNEQADFIPGAGELIIYSPDSTHEYSRLKVGDGITTVISLPFIDAGTINGEQVSSTIVKAENKYSFPPIGQESKLYIDLENNAIYCYKSASGYSQLSHFQYTASKVQINTINSWNPGTMTSASVTNNVLTITNGSAPVLELGTINIVTDINEVNE